ncbi:hypothetical protein [Streptomyces virginiae]|uniref:hypothetical protein n=1 Tax=Streptomyces virginiae TaxID=1961 RepID=UPI0034306FDD
MRRGQRIAARAAVLLVVFAGFWGGASVPWADGEALTERQLVDALPRGEDLPGHRVDVQRPHSEFGGATAPCRPLADVLWAPHPHTWTARARVATRLVGSGGDGPPGFSLELTSYSEEQATAFMSGLEKALPRCAVFEGQPHFEEWPRKFTLQPVRAPKGAGDGAVAFDLDGGGPGADGLRRFTVVRIGGVIAVYVGKVATGVQAQVHHRLTR